MRARGYFYPALAVAGGGRGFPGRLSPRLPSLSSAGRGSGAAVDFIREKQGAAERAGGERGREGIPAAGGAGGADNGGAAAGLGSGDERSMPWCTIEEQRKSLEMPRRERFTRHVRTRERRR